MSIRLHTRWLKRQKLYRRWVLSRQAEPSWMFLSHVSGVVHVGGNVGQERFLYAKLGLNVVWIEPLPDVFAMLCRNIDGIAGQRALMALVTDRDGGEYEFNIASNNGMSSSILPMKQHLDVWPEISYTGKLKLRSVTLASLLLNHQTGSREPQALVIDTQGSELLVLRGSVPLLKDFEFIKVEVADFESYEGGCQMSDVSSFMIEHGYRELLRVKFAQRDRGGAYFDVVYRRGGQP